MRKWPLLLISLLSLMAASSSAQEQCGWQAGGALCPGGLCCSKWGYCGTTSYYCGDGCQSQCPGDAPPAPPPPPTPPPPPSGGDDISSIITEALFEEMLKHRNDPRCPGNGFYSYEAFISAAKSFPAFGTTGDTKTRKREIAAFFGQTSHETTGGWPTAEDGPYAWGYCFLEEEGGRYLDYCVASEEWPCAAGKKYYGRGPIQLSYNYNYGPAGVALNYDLLDDPDALARDRILSFQAALWFWMTPQSPKPSCHDVITGQWLPSSSDVAAGRVPGYGVITNIINGGVECGHGYDDRVANRIGFYQRYCDLLGIEDSNNLDCYTQRPFNEQLSALPI